MARSFLCAFATFTVVGIAAGTGCRSTGVGDPCIPEQEYDPAFLGFDVGQVNVESKSFQCETRVCLVNHFQGRVSCPYGQSAAGSAPAGATACTLPSSQKRVGVDDQGNPLTSAGAEVKPQCVDRVAANAVYCSCRCANEQGRTDDGARYCACPDTYVCTQLVPSIGPFDQGVTGAYCVRRGTEYNAQTGACGALCAPGGNDGCNGTQTGGGADGG